MRYQQKTDKNSCAFSKKINQNHINYNEITEVTIHQKLYQLKMNNWCLFVLGLSYVYVAYEINLKIISQILFHLTDITLMTNNISNTCLISLIIEIINDKLTRSYLIYIIITSYNMLRIFITKIRIHVLSNFNFQIESMGQFISKT